MRWLLLGFVFLELACGPGPKVDAPPPELQTPKPSDESRRFPKANLTGTQVIDKELLGKIFMPGGTLAHYKKGPIEYEMFVTKMANPTDAAILLPDWRRTLIHAELVPSFGGYFGQDSGRPVFVFTKGPWVAGVAGLPLKDADREARTLAAQLN